MNNNIGASLSEPHIDKLNLRNLLLGASLSESHIDKLNACDPYIIIITSDMHVILRGEPELMCACACIMYKPSQ